MKVKELIEKLQTFNQDADLDFIYVDSSGWPCDIVNDPDYVVLENMNLVQVNFGRI